MIRPVLADIGYCYEHVLSRLPEISGVIVVNFDIGADGKVVRAQAAGVHEEVAACVADVIRTLRFPPHAGPRHVRVPFTFSPNDEP